MSSANVICQTQTNSSTGSQIFNQIKSTTDSAGSALMGTFKATTSMFNAPNSTVSDNLNPVEDGTEPEPNHYRQNNNQRNQPKDSEEKAKPTLLEQMKLKAGIGSAKNQGAGPMEEDESSNPASGGESILVQIKTKTEAAGAVIMEQIQHGVKATSNLTSKVFASGNEEGKEEEGEKTARGESLVNRDSDEGGSERMSDVRLSDGEESITQRRTSIFDTLKSKVGLGTPAGSSVDEDPAAKESMFEQFKSKVGIKSGQQDNEKAIDTSHEESNKDQVSIFDQLKAKANAAKVNIFNQQHNNNTGATSSSASPTPSSSFAPQSDSSAPRRFKERPARDAAKPPSSAASSSSSVDSSTASSPLSEVSGFFSSLTGGGDDSKNKGKNNGDATSGSFFDSFSTKSSSTNNNNQTSFLDSLTGSNKKEESSSWL